MRPSPTDPTTMILMDQARAAHAAGRWSEAEAAYRRILLAVPDYPEVAGLYGVLALQLRQPATAAPLLKRAVDQAPDQPAHVINLALALARLGQVEAATDWLNRAVGLAPADTAALKAQAERRLVLGQNSTARRWAKRAAALAPGDMVVPVTEPAAAVVNEDIAWQAPSERAGLPPMGALAHLLVVKLDEIGDFVLATPFLRGLRASAPTADITLAVNPLVYGLALGCPFVDHVVMARPDGGGARRLDGAPADLAAVLDRRDQGGWPLAILPRYDSDRHGAAELARGLGAKLLAGFAPDLTAGDPAAVARQAGFYDAIYRPASFAHEVQQNAGLLAWLGGVADTGPTELWLTDTDQAAAARVLAPLAGRAFLAVCPGGSHPRKRFPVSRYRTIATELCRAQNLALVAVGGPDDVTAAALLGADLDLTGRLSLPISAAVLGRAALTLANDSAPAHLAAAMGGRVVVPFAHPLSGNLEHVHAPRRFRPWGQPGKVTVIQPVQAWAPCTGGCDAPTQHCIGLIPDEAILVAARALLPPRR